MTVSLPPNNPKISKVGSIFLLMVEKPIISTSCCLLQNVPLLRSFCLEMSRQGNKGSLAIGFFATLCITIQNRQTGEQRSHATCCTKQQICHNGLEEQLQWLGRLDEPVPIHIDNPGLLAP
jgi:hypothetical protein